MFFRETEFVLFLWTVNVNTNIQFLWPDHHIMNLVYLIVIVDFFKYVNIWYSFFFENTWWVAPKPSIYGSLATRWLIFLVYWSTYLISRLRLPILFWLFIENFIGISKTKFRIRCCIWWTETKRTLVLKTWDDTVCGLKSG